MIMKKSSTPINIEEPISVTDFDIEEAEKIEHNPIKMLELIDLIFLGMDRDEIYS